MIKIKIITTALLSLVLVFGCSEDELTDKPDEGVTNRLREIEVTLDLGVKSGIQLSGRTSSNPRAAGIEGRTKTVLPRMIESWDPAQQVNDMRIYVFRTAESNGKDGTYTYYIPENATTGYFNVTNEEKGIFSNSVPHTGAPETHTYAIKPRLEEGYWYKFLAVGRDDKYATPLSEVTDYSEWGYKILKETQFKENITTFNDASISLEQNESGDDYAPVFCTEIFSGVLQNEEDALHVTAGLKRFSRTITLKRAVAGLLVYVKNIPYEVVDDDSGREFTPTHLVIAGSYISTSVGLANRMGIPDKGTDPSFPPILGVIDLRGWSNNGTIFTRPAEKGWMENSYSFSNFIMPTSEESISSLGGKSVFKLVYRGMDGSRTAKCTIKVKLKDEAIPKYLFDIEADHLYSLGRKDKDYNEPYDLSSTRTGYALSPAETGNEIAITAIPDWEDVSDLKGQ